MNQEITYAGDVGPDDTLESLITLSDGNTSYNFRVVEGEIPIGQIDMKDLVKALVPRVSAAEHQPL
jgi:glycine betaine/proline transport system ATP-binding protein